MANTWMCLVMQLDWPKFQAMTLIGMQLILKTKEENWKEETRKSQIKEKGKIRSS